MLSHEPNLMPSTLEQYHIYKKRPIGHEFVKMILEQTLRLYPNLKGLSAYYKHDMDPNSLLRHMVNFRLHERLVVLRCSLDMYGNGYQYLAQFQQLKQLEIWAYCRSLTDLPSAIQPLINLEYLKIDFDGSVSVASLKAFMETFSAGNVPIELKKFTVGIRGGGSMKMRKQWASIVAGIPCECQLVDNTFRGMPMIVEYPDNIHAN